MIRRLACHPFQGTTRRTLGAALLAAPRLSRAQPGWPRRVTDVLGRAVAIPRQPKAVLLGESFQLLNLNLLHPDPVSLLVGMGGDLRIVDPVSHAALGRRFPALAKVPELTTGVGQSFSAERALALQPDLVILALWQNASDEVRQMVELLGRAGVPAVFVDFFMDPVANTLPSMRLLGQALGREEAGEAFARFHEERMARLRSRVATAGPGPAVLMQAFPGRWPCCWVSGTDGGGTTLGLLGARNVAAAMLPTPRGGQLGVEQVLTLRPEVYIGTGLYRPEETQGLRLGTGASAGAARDSLAEVVKAPELANLPAVKAGRAHGLWNAFNGTAINVVAAEATARWLRPELFPDLDPAASLAEINARFAAMPFEGTYWTSL